MRIVNRKGYTMTVEFFGRNDSGETVSEGTLTLRDGKLVATPAGALKGVLDTEVWIHRDPDPPIILNAIDHPEEFLKNLVQQYHGSYFWAKAVD